MGVCKHGFRSSFISYFMKDASRRGFLRLSRVLPISRVFTSGYVNAETILHFFSSTREKSVYEQLTVYGGGCSLFSVLWHDFVNNKNVPFSVTTTQRFFILN